MPHTHHDCPAGVIITGGLGGDADQLIIAQFHLFLGVIEVDVKVKVVGGGRPVSEIPYYLRPDEEPWQPRDDAEKEVIIKVRLGSKEVERHYFRKNADRAIKAINFLNNTRTRYTITVDEVKNIKPFVYLKNLRKKD